MPHRNFSRGRSLSMRLGLVDTHKGLKIALHTLLAQPYSAGNEETWPRLAAKFPPEDRTAVSEGAAAAVLASATDVEDRRAPPFRPSHEYTS